MKKLAILGTVVTVLGLAGSFAAANAATQSNCPLAGTPQCPLVHKVSCPACAHKHVGHHHHVQHHA